MFCIAYSVVNYLNVSFSRLITSVGGERADFFFCSEGFPLPLGAMYTNIMRFHAKSSVFLFFNEFVKNMFFKLM